MPLIYEVQYADNPHEKLGRFSSKDEAIQHANDLCSIDQSEGKKVEVAEVDEQTSSGRSIPNIIFTCTG
jgi:hypothetical protein